MNSRFLIVTSTAASKISELLADEQKDGSGLRVFVQGGGCSGFQYGLGFDHGAQEGDDRTAGLHRNQRSFLTASSYARRAAFTLSISETSAGGTSHHDS